ncbi:hypothetical protein CPAR01_10440 [Colletotrichum paranaense]|uniref:Uncharacterized protein n=1 Tax=Colletotrichum paranaense TaxID=1914294 RepID=A0ABQ9SFB6_9PEZI|nr:uncharacterized protein CPAR01_10440 [Colletotrichum paranaense]KAK1533732.1 hypothetical protein CPAR01_10440 [Colletotrichum paranaense]
MLLLALPCKGSEELTLKHLGKSLEHLGTEANNPPSSLDFGQDRRSGGRCAEPPPGPGCAISVCAEQGARTYYHYISCTDHRPNPHEQFRFRMVACARQPERVCSVILGSRARESPRGWFEPRSTAGRGYHSRMPRKRKPWYGYRYLEAWPTLSAQSQGHLTSESLSPFQSTTRGASAVLGRQGCLAVSKSCFFGSGRLVISRNVKARVLLQRQESVPARGKICLFPRLVSQVPSFCHQQACELQHTKQHSSENRRNHNTLLGLLPIESKFGPHTFERDFTGSSNYMQAPRQPKHLARRGEGQVRCQGGGGCAISLARSPQSPMPHSVWGFISRVNFFNLVLLVDVHLRLQSLSMWLTTKTG